MARTFRDRVLDREVLLGTFLNLGSAAAAECCALAGFSWLLVDLEHGVRGEDGLVPQILAGHAHGVPVLVRVESPERIRAGRVLDLGVDGVMFPRLNNAEEARSAIRHILYPPGGDRGVATYIRAAGFGLQPEALDSAADQVMGIVQIESRSAVEDVEQIAAVPGVHVLFVGPRDLSWSLSPGGKVDRAELHSATSAVARAAASRGKAAGIMVGNRSDLETYIDQGFTFIAYGSDSMILANAARDAAHPTAAKPA
jgi:2-dehydro-3-deoxyglucarate aldolase/4-hydroxy-2-oxoheptanedioate aldolase